MKLDPKFKEEWVAALRSGEYEQGDCELYNKTSNSYCCIGVAAVVCGLSLDTINEYGLMDMDIDPSTLKHPVPVELTDWNELSTKLTNMNDSGNYTFTNIADYIEENL